MIPLNNPEWFTKEFSLCEERPWRLGHLCKPVVEKHTESLHRQKAKGKETEMQIDCRKICMREFLVFFWMPIFFFGPCRTTCAAMTCFICCAWENDSSTQSQGSRCALDWVNRDIRPDVGSQYDQEGGQITGDGSFDNLIEIIHVWWQLTHIDENITSHLCSWLVHPPLVNSAPCYIQHFADKVEDPTASICIVHLSKKKKSWLWRVQIPWFRVIPQCLK